MVKGPISDQVTEKCCGCFLASTIVSQWMRSWGVGRGLLGACTRGRALGAGKLMQEKTLADVHVRVCMYRAAAGMSMIYGGMPGCKMVCCAVP